MNIKFAVLGAALAGFSFAPPAGARVIYDSISDLTVAPFFNSFCSQCGGNGSSIGQALSFPYAVTFFTVSFTVQSSFAWPTPVTVGIYNDAAGTVGTKVYNNTFSSFASDVPTVNNTDVVTVDLPAGGVSLAGGKYLIFFTNPDSLGIPAYYGIGAGNMVYDANSSSPLLSGDLYSSVSGYDAGVSITGVPEASTWVMMLAGFAGLGLAGYRRTKNTAHAALTAV
jgi:hypothetical protein